MIIDMLSDQDLPPNRSLLNRASRAFSEHPASVGESYVEHFAVASGFGWALLKASAACFVHAVLPCAFERTGSLAITELQEQMVSKRARSSV